MSKKYSELQELLKDYKVIPLGKAKDLTNVKINKLTFLYRIQPHNKEQTAHYKASSKFGGQEAFEVLQKNDKKKVEFCQKNNIQLIIIKYDENIEEILQKNLL